MINVSRVRLKTAGSIAVNLIMIILCSPVAHILYDSRLFVLANGAAAARPTVAALPLIDLPGLVRTTLQVN